MPPPQICPGTRDVLVITTACVDASHAADKETRRRLTGFIILLNRAPIILYSKIQNTVEDITFYSEFTKSKAYIEHITALRFKLCMFRIPVVEYTRILCDNVSVPADETTDSRPSRGAPSPFAPPPTPKPSTTSRTGRGGVQTCIWDAGLGN